MKLHFNMQISTFNNVFNIKIFANVFGMQIIHLFRGKKPRMKEQELSNSIKEHDLTWYQQCKVSMLCGTVHPPLLWVSATTVWEHL